MKYLLLLLFLIPVSVNATGNLNIAGGSYATSTPNNPVLISGFDTTNTGSNGVRYRIFTPGTFVNGVVANSVDSWSGMYGSPDMLLYFNASSNVLANFCRNCDPIGRWTVAEYASSTALTTTDTVFIDVYNSSPSWTFYRYFFMLLLVVGGLISVVRPLIIKLSLK